MTTGTEALGTEPAGGGGTAPAAAAAPDWATGYEPEVASWAAGKGYKTPADLAKGYYSLEKAWGADKAGRSITVPTDANDQAAWDQVWAKLGRPDDPKGYGIQIEGASEEFVNHLAATMHKAGLSPAQAKVVADGWAERQRHVAGLAEAEEVERRGRSEAEVAELKRGWGAETDAKLDLGRRAARALGLEQEAMSAVEQVLGTKAFLSMMVKVGEALREDPGVGTTSGAFPGLPTTPEGAKAMITSRMEDKEFRQRLFNDSDPAHAAAKREWNELHKRAHPQ